MSERALAYAKLVTPHLPRTQRQLVELLATLATTARTTPISVKRLARLTGRSLAGIYQSLRALEQRGIVRRERQHDAVQGNTPNRYVFVALETSELHRHKLEGTMTPHDQAMEAVYQEHKENVS